MAMHHMKRQTINRFPLATVAYYGADDRTTTKIAVCVIPAPGRNDGPLKRWAGAGVRNDPYVRTEINVFLQAHGVKAVAVSQGNMGCIHEEGLDFPVGGDCPFCPFWKGKQGSGGPAREIIGTVLTLKEFLAQAP